MCQVNLHTSYEMLLTWAEMSFHTTKKDFKNPLNGNCILLDSCSRPCIFGKHLLTNLCKAEEPVKIKCNGGIREAGTIANFGRFQVWYDDEAIANILSQKAVKAKYRVTYDSKNEGSFCEHNKNGIIEFKEHPNGLHYATMDEIKGIVKNKENRCLAIIDYEYDDDVAMFVDTICRKYGYTKQEVERAIAARHLQVMIRSPSQSDFEGMVCVNMMYDTNLKLSDCQCSHDIFGKNLIDVRKKTVRKNSERVEVDYEAVPDDVIKNENVVLNVDVMFINRFHIWSLIVGGLGW